MFKRFKRRFRRWLIIKLGGSIKKPAQELQGAVVVRDENVRGRSLMYIEETALRDIVKTIRAAGALEYDVVYDSTTGDSVIRWRVHTLKREV